MWDTLFLVLKCAVKPTTLSELTLFYVDWIAIYCGINIVWDIRSEKTAPFHLHNLKDKITVVYNASSMASSVLLLISLFSPQVKALAVDTVVPLLLAGISGVLLGIGEICPYKPGAQPFRRKSSD